MTEPLYVNADWSALVPAGSAEAAFGIQPKDAKRLGLLPKEPGEVIEEPEVLVTANAPEPTPPEPEPIPSPEPEAKEAPPPADKQATRPADKARRRSRRK